MQKAPAASRAGIKEQERQELKSKKQGSRWDTGNGDQGPLHRGCGCCNAAVHGAVQLCISYPDLVKSHSSCPAPLSLQPGAGVGLVFEKLEAGSSHCLLIPLVPLKEEKQAKGNF